MPPLVGTAILRVHLNFSW